MARAAPRAKSMSRPRVKGPRSLIVTIVEMPVRGLVTFNLVPKGNLLCAALRPPGRKVWPLAVWRPELYCVAFIELRGQPDSLVAASAIPPAQVMTSNEGMSIFNAILNSNSELSGG